MPQYPRRTLLGGIGTTMALGLAGTTVGSTDANADRDPADAPSFETLLDPLPASVATEPMTVSVMDLERRREANEPTDPYAATGAFRIDDEAVAKQAVVYATGDEFTRSVTVLTGDIDLDGDGESRETDDGVAYDRYEAGDQVAAVTDEAVVIARETDVLADAVAAGAGDAERLLEESRRVEEALDVFEDADGYSVNVGDDFQPPETDATAEYVVRAMTVRGPDTIALDFGIAFTDADDVTDELAERLEGEFAYMATSDEPTAEIDGSLVTVSAERDLAAERAAREHDSPGALYPERDPDLEDDYLEIEIGHGDPTPVEDLTLEVGDEEYDRDIWTNGHGTLEEGDTIVIETDDVEPDLEVTLTHDHEYGSSSSTTTILGHFRFDFAYDPDARELDVEYADEFPLDGDEVWLAVHEDRPAYGFREDDPEPAATAQPWTGTMRSGDDATLEGVDPGSVVYVCWGEPNFRESIATHRTRPPGTVEFEYDYEDRSLSATLELDGDGERPASAYELLIDGEPADTQWADAADTVASGSTIEADAVPVGADVTVVWGEDDVRVGRAYPQPTVELAFTDDGTAVEHVGGNSVDASKLEARVWTGEENVEIDLADEIDGDFEEGDTVPIDASASSGVNLVYEGNYYIGYAYQE